MGIPGVATSQASAGQARRCAGSILIPTHCDDAEAACGTQYVRRHSFATRMRKILPADRLAKLMGHKDRRMLLALYDHSGDDAEHMLGLLKRAG